MQANRVFVAALAIAAFACSEAPTAARSANAKAEFTTSTANSHFLAVSATGPTADGFLIASFKLAGLGSAPVTVTGTADGSVAWACETSVPGEFDVLPTESRSAGVIASATPTMKNGQSSGSFGIPSPDATIQCLPKGHTLVPISAAFSNVSLAAGATSVQTIPGVFSNVFFTISPEVVPTITSVSLTTSTLTIGGAQTTFTATVHNPNGTLEGALLQNWVRQGKTFRAGDFSLLNCTSTLGELLNGDCTVTFSLGASNGAAYGSGDLVAGAATFEVMLMVGASNRVMSDFNLPLTLQ